MTRSQLVVATWNINGGRTPSGDLFDVVACLRREAAQIVALQELEVPAPLTDSEFAKLLCDQTGYTDSVVRSLSPSHFERGARLALGILSDLPLLSVRFHSFMNPGMVNVQTGEVSHDKGMISAEVISELGPLSISALHFSSFGYFDVDERRPEFEATWESFSDSIDHVGAQGGAIVMGDFNSQYRYTLLRQLLHGDLNSAFSRFPEKLSRHLNDDILLGRGLTMVTLEREVSQSDHDVLRAIVTDDRYLSRY